MYINIAFCFDQNIAKQVQVTLASLLDHTKTADVHYHIYCICTKEAAYIEQCLKEIIETTDRSTTLTVKAIENPYQGSYEVREVSTGTYLRLALPRLLPEVDKILYTDVDVLFLDSPDEIWQWSMEGYVLAAVKGAVNFSDKWEWNSDRPYWKHMENMRGKYINAGVTLLNLSEIRKRNLEKQWETWAQQKLYYQDQDILNITCQDAIRYLPPRYNRFAYMEEKEYGRFVSERILTEPECRAAIEHPAIIHYAGDKPWKRYDTNLGYLWWDYVNSRPELSKQFDVEKAKKYHGPTLLERGARKMKKIFSREKL
ncbi:MAG: glycosyltransferase family 8 protein [Lachnospiraceae bacterium]|nr:glycosyltransferase family 8 protein [Lachnospiraceae bacterium]